MTSVDIGIGHDYDLVICKLVDVDSLRVVGSSDGNAQSAEEARYLLIVEDLMLHGFLDVEDLASDRQNSLKRTVAALLGRSACRISLDNEEFAVFGMAARTVGELAGQTSADERRLAQHFLAGIAGGIAGLGGNHDLLDNSFRLTRILFKIVAQSLADGSLDSADNFAVAELGLCLAFELRFHDLHRDHCRQTLAEVIARNLDLDLFEKLVVFGILLEGLGQSAAETGQMSTSLNSVDIVDKRIDILVISAVVGQRHFHGNAGALGLKMDNIIDQRLFVLVDIFDKLTQTVLAVEYLFAGFFAAQVGKGQRYSGIEEREITQTVGQSIIVVDGDGENRRIGAEGY